MAHVLVCPSVSQSRWWVQAMLVHLETRILGIIERYFQKWCLSNTPPCLWPTWRKRWRTGVGSGLEEKLIQRSRKQNYIFVSRWIKTTGLEKEKLMAVLKSQDILRGAGKHIFQNWNGKSIESSPSPCSSAMQLKPSFNILKRSQSVGLPSKLLQENNVDAWNGLAGQHFGRQQWMFANYINNLVAFPLSNTTPKVKWGIFLSSDRDARKPDLVALVYLLDNGGDTH